MTTYHCSPSRGYRPGPFRPARFIVSRAITRHSIRGEPASRRALGSRPPGTSSRRHQLPQHVLQDAAVLEVVELVQRIDAANHWNALEAAVGGDDLGDHALARLDLAVQPADGHLLVATQPERLPGRALLEAQRQHAHADEVRAMDAFERLGDDGPHAEQAGSLRRPVARGSAAVFLAGEDDERNLVVLVAHGGVED